MKCTLCPLGEAKHVVCSRIPARDTNYGIAKGTYKYLLVGEAPGREENFKGLPFMGQAGNLLDNILEKLSTEQGLDLSEVAITNAVRCQPEHNANPPMACKRTCRQFLEEEVDKFKPEVIIAMGGQALSSLTDKPSIAIGPHRLSVDSFRSVPLVSTYHPAAVLYDRTKLRDIYEDLEAYLVRRVWDKPAPSKIKWEMIEDIFSYRTFLGKLEHHKRIGIDLETDGLRGRILTVSLSFPEGPEGPLKGYCIPVGHPQSPLLPYVRAILTDLKVHLLMREDLTLVGHNVKFDIAALARESHLVGAVRSMADDSMVYHYMLNEHSSNRSLDFLSRQYTQEGGYKEEVDRANLVAEDLDKVAKYNVKDTVLPPLIIKKLENDLRAEHYYSDRLVEWYRRATPFAAALEFNGFAVDRKELEKVEQDLTEKQTALRERAQEMAGEINMDSPKQLSEFIYGTLGLPVPDIKDAYGKSGMPSTRADVLEKLKGKHEFTDTLIQFRKISKDLRVYVGSVRTNLSSTSIVHPEYFITKSPRGGTVSGRFSAKNPPLQTFPYTSIRRCFVSRYGTSGCLLDLDANQMELRCAAFLSRDNTLLDIFRSNQDPHQATADLCQVERPIGKRVNFAGIYGVSVNGLVEKAGLDYGTASKVAKILRRDWAGLYTYLKGVGYQAVQRGQVATPYGRWRRVPGATPSTPEGSFLLREAQNFVIQATASDIVQLLGWRLMVAFDKLALPVMSNHDGITFDLKEENLEEVKEILKTEIFNLPTLLYEILGLKLDLPLDFDTKIGYNWLDQEKQETYTTNQKEKA